jgi:hypothetical protein
MRSRCLAVLLPACLAFQAAQATDCDFTRNKVDKFTKTRLVDTEWKQLRTDIGGSYDEDLIDLREVFIRSAVHGDRRSILLQLQTQDTSMNFAPDPNRLRWALAFNPASSLLITLADGSVVTLKGQATVSGDVKVKRDGKVHITESTTVIPFTVEAEQMQQLMAQPATRIRAHGAMSQFDFQLRKKSLGHVRKVLGCIQ